MSASSNIPTPEPAEDGRERRSEETREALIQAGVELFGDYGVQGTTSRMLASASQTNIAAINYHFGSKEGLYLAVAGWIAERMEERLRGARESALKILQEGPPNAETAIRIVSNVIDHVAGLMVDSDEVRTWARIIVREQTKPTLAFDILYRERMEKSQKNLARLIGFAVGIDPTSAEAKIRAHALMGQLLVFAISRESLLRALDTPKLTSAHRHLIRRILKRHVEACLAVKLPDAKPSVI
mgnify:CR=1 FL=1